MRISDWSSDVCSSDLKIPLPTITHRDAIGSRIAHGALGNAERYQEVCGIGEIALVRQVSGKHRDLNRGIVQFDCRASVEQPISLHDAKLISQRILILYAFRQCFGRGVLVESAIGSASCRARVCQYV